MIVYGPVPSRRLGQSVSINNIPPKVCTYSCIYCQLGKTNKMQVERREFYKPEDIYREVGRKLEQLDLAEINVDYLSFVPDGEPTLDKNLGKGIDLLRSYNIKIAIITNASLIWMDDVKEDLMKADWVSVKLDTADENTWHRIDRPHGSLRHEDILKGIVDFSKRYKGTLVTETMLVDSVNDHAYCFEKIAERLIAIQPDKAYLLVPTRPPAESSVKRASAESIAEATRIIRNWSGIDVECITGDEAGDGFFVAEDIAEDLLSIASVHPVREDIVDELLAKRNVDKAAIDKLVKNGRMLEFWYEGKKFYVKNTRN